MKYDICVVTGTRAEYGVLRPVLSAIKNNACAQLDLMVTGTHLSPAFGNTVNEIIRDGFEDYRAVPIPIDDDSRRGMAHSTGVAIDKFSAFFSERCPDILVVLGDRFETFAAAVAAYLLRIPIAHISGGDVTEGAVDDGLRHCITKLSSIHFPGSEKSAQRLIQMGEEPETVYKYGDTGVENCLNVKKLPRKQLADILKFPQMLEKYAVVTFHPVTMEPDSAVRQIKELISAMEALDDISYIITMANADAGGRIINAAWEDAVKKNKNWLLTPSLGVQKYLSALTYASVVLGNSSSGVVEAPVLKVPTVNIGDRQKGREMAKSVICCETKKGEIIKSVKKALSEEWLNEIKSDCSVFDNMTTSEKIVDTILTLLRDGKIKDRKVFHDII